MQIEVANQRILLLKDLLLAKSGRVDVYGIYFDVSRATIKPESEPVLKEISDALAKNPAWKLRVEGHTDNVGGDASNMGLSSTRLRIVWARQSGGLSECPY